MRYSNLFFVLFLGVSMMSLSMCKNKQSDQIGKSEAVTAPDYDADSAFYFVKLQTDFGPRVPNTAAHDSCADALTQVLLQYCDTVINQIYSAKAYNGTTLHGNNIVGVFNPEKEKRILLSAHWDSRHVADHDPVEANRKQPIDGANDGASGVGVLLELARQLAMHRPEVGVDIVLFDLEDYGPEEGYNAPEGEWWGLGSQYWANNPHVADYKANYGILLDMVGDPSARFRYEYSSYIYAHDVQKLVWSAAYKLGFSSTFVAKQSNPIIDDHTYINTIAKIPMIDIIHQEDGTGTGFPATWHTLNDNISHIDKNMLATVGKTLLYVIYNEK